MTNKHGDVLKKKREKMVGNAKAKIGMRSCDKLDKPYSEDNPELNRKVTG